jgi:hypothetical protein
MTSMGHHRAFLVLENTYTGALPILIQHKWCRFQFSRVNVTSVNTQTIDANSLVHRCRRAGRGDQKEHRHEETNAELGTESGRHRHEHWMRDGQTHTVISLASCSFYREQSWMRTNTAVPVSGYILYVYHWHLLYVCRSFRPRHLSTLSCGLSGDEATLHLLHFFFWCVIDGAVSLSEMVYIF